MLEQEFDEESRWVEKMEAQPAVVVDVSEGGVSQCAWNEV